MIVRSPEPETLTLWRRRTELGEDSIHPGNSLSFRGKPIAVNGARSGVGEPGKASITEHVVREAVAVACLVGAGESSRTFGTTGKIHVRTTDAKVYKVFSPTRAQVRVRARGDCRRSSRGRLPFWFFHIAAPEPRRNIEEAL
jgi:hypothetical protein